MSFTRKNTRGASMDFDKLPPEKKREILEEKVKKLVEKMRETDAKKPLIIEIDDPNAPAFQTVGRTRRGVRIIKANRDSARRAAKRAAFKYRALMDSAA